MSVLLKPKTSLIAALPELPLKLSVKNKQTGLFIYCNKCKNEPKEGRCCITGGVCRFPEKQVYKIRIHISGTKNAKKSKVLPVRDEGDAAQMALKLRNEFKQDVFSSEPSASLYTIEDHIKSFVESKKAPPKNKKPLSPATIADYELHLSHLRFGLLEKKINTRIITSQDIRDTTAEILFRYLQKQFDSQVTHKKYFNTFETFFNYVKKKEALQVDNPFNGWHFEEKESENEIIYPEEFYKLPQAIKEKPTHFDEESGYNRKIYYPWLWNGFRLALFTGARRQEVPIIKWTDIVQNKYTGKLPGGFVMLQDLKVTGIKKLDRVKIKPIEINEDLADLLVELGYNKMKMQDKYIVDPNEDYTREFIKEYLSKSFAYYIKFAAPNRKLSFGCLRKTWFTNCAIAVGDAGASQMGGHSDKEVTLAHYINELETAGTRGKFKRVFLPPTPPSKKKKKRK